MESTATLPRFDYSSVFGQWYDSPFLSSRVSDTWAKDIYDDELYAKPPDEFAPDFEAFDPYFYKWFFNSHPPSLGERRIRSMSNWITSKFLMQIYRRVHYNKKNFIGVITGDPGSGKSWTAVQFARWLDPYFTHKNIVYTPQQFFQRLGEINRVGTAIIWDEAGVGLPAREWQGIVNRAIGKTLQVFRQTKAGRIFLFFVTPDLSYIDKQARKLLNFFSVARRRAGENTVLNVYKVKVDRFDISSQGLFYRIPRFPVTTPTGMRVMITLRSFKIAPLPKPWQVAYKMASQVTKEDLISQYIAYAGEEAAEKTMKKLSRREKLDSAIEYVRTHLEEVINNKGKVDTDLILYVLRDRDINASMARTIKKAIEKEMADELALIQYELKRKKKSVLNSK